MTEWKFKIQNVKQGGFKELSLLYSLHILYILLFLLLLLKSEKLINC